MSIHGGTGTGGHSGSESGWTMYIGSHISGAETYNDDYGQQHYCYGNTNSHHYQRQRGVEAESDDSMASDASSGPSHQELPCVSGEGRRRINSYKHTDDNDESYSGRKSEKQGKQRDERRVKKPEKEKSSAHSHKVHSAASYVRTKPRKNK